MTALVTASLWSALLVTAADAEVASLIDKIRAVGAEGKGNVAAAKAWQQLVARGPDVLLDVLGALDSSKPRAANWLRGAVDAIAEQTLNSGKPLPAAKLESFVRERRHDGRARRLAYEWLLKVDASAADRLLAGMLDDPGQELRRDAVAVLLAQAEKLFEADNKAAAKSAYFKVFEHARDKDQVILSAERLEKLGEVVDLRRQFGFVTRWMLVGPFNNLGGVGFDAKFPPEKGVNLAAKYVDKDGKKVVWQEHVSTEKLGLVDLNKVIGHLKGAVVFGHAVVESPLERPVEIRAGSNNAVRIFLNGKEIYFREEYHHGMRMDQHVGRGVLKAGRNEILIKVCQNEQTEPWAQQWSFQLRICDALGAAVPVTVLGDK